MKFYIKIKNVLPTTIYFVELFLLKISQKINKTVITVTLIKLQFQNSNSYFIIYYITMISFISYKVA